ncbi:MAG: metal-dependent hydrolase [Gemmatimonadetes bacterium]|nr:metal-dependent hydrolase [Gemmatimonadota bacterium]
MASPIGHAAVGVAVASVVARATGTESSAPLWIGAIVASGIPDLDFVFPLLGFDRRYHRNASHSLFLIGAAIALGFVIARHAAPEFTMGVLLAWTASLISHPLLDVFTTGPTLGKIGWGIPLFWPVSRRRFFVTRSIVGDRPEGVTLDDTLREMQDDARRIVPICAAVVLLTFLLR